MKSATIITPHSKESVNCITSGIELLQKRLDQGEFAEFERQVCWSEERGMPTEPVIELILDLEKEQEQLIQQVRREEVRLRRELLNEEASNQGSLRLGMIVGVSTFVKVQQRQQENWITTVQPTKFK
jgi:hypothetical protein